MKASGKIGSNGVQVSDSVEKRFETDIYIYIYMFLPLRWCLLKYLVLFSVVCECCVKKWVCAEGVVVAWVSVLLSVAGCAQFLHGVPTFPSVCDV
jgi:hypothetical protein